MLVQEIERLNSVIKSMQPELEQAKQRVQVHIDIEIQYKELYSKFSIIETRCAELERMRVLWQEERSMLQDKLTQQDKSLSQFASYEARIREFEAQALLSTQESKRLSLLLQSRVEEFEQAREKYKKLEIVLAEYKLFEVRYNETQSKYLELLKENDALRATKKELESKFALLSTIDTKISEYESRILLFTSEIEKLNIVILNKNKEIEETKAFIPKLELEISEYKEYVHKNAFLNSEIDRLQLIIREYKEEVESWKMKFVEYGSLHSRVQEQLVVIVMAAVEIESLRARVLEKESQLAEMRKSNINQFKL